MSAVLNIPGHRRITLATLADNPFWVAWQKEKRGGNEKASPTKLPYNPKIRHLQGAKANDASTWGTRLEAEAKAKQLLRPYGDGGIGIELTKLGDGRNTGGVDLDTCRDPETGELTDWAKALIDRLATYTEVSPSGEGVKAFFTFASSDFLTLRLALGKAGGGRPKFSRSWKLDADSDHPPGVELHLGNRYFTVTDQILSGFTDELRTIDTEDLLRLIEVDLPAFLSTQSSTRRPAQSVTLAKNKRGRSSRADLSRSAEAFKVGGTARRGGATFEQMCSAIRENPDTADWFHEKGEADGGRELQRIWEHTDPASADLVLDPDAPLRSANSYLQRHHTLNGLRTLFNHNGKFYNWNGSSYIDKTIGKMRSNLYSFLETAKRINQSGQVIAFSPTKSKVDYVLDAISAATHLDETIHPPAWLGVGEMPPASEIISCANGLLHLPSGKLYPQTPAFFAHNSLPFDYNPAAGPPEAFVAFLGTVWPNDKQAIDTLQEMFGLALTSDTQYQKAFLLVGPKRSGKGTIARVLTQLLGAENVCNPTLSSFDSGFGLSPLIGKRLAIISDARLSGKADQQVMVERLLTITGEDGLTINRKHRDFWNGKLDTRFVILTNEMPRFTDSSVALASRFIILRMTESFIGKEDLNLGTKLSTELPGILNWAIEG